MFMNKSVHEQVVNNAQTLVNTCSWTNSWTIHEYFMNNCSWTQIEKRWFKHCGQKYGQMGVLFMVKSQLLSVHHRKIMKMWEFWDFLCGNRIKESRRDIRFEKFTNAVTAFMNNNVHYLFMNIAQNLVNTCSWTCSWTVHERVHEQI